MSGDFAATVAAVAPIVLLVAAVEVNNARPRMTEAREAVHAQVTALRATADGRPLAGEEAGAAMDNWWQIWWQLGKYSAYLLYLMASIGMAGALVCAEWIALRWLATPGAGADSSNAQFLILTTSLSFVWVVLPPFAALYFAWLQNMRLMMAAAWLLLRINRAVLRSGDETEATT